MSDASRRAAGRTRVWVAVGLTAVVLVWLLAGTRRLDPVVEFAVAEGPFPGSIRRVDGSWTLAPPGLVSLTRYPRNGIELPLPQAEQAGLRTSEGTRFGFRGWVTVRPRPESWRELHVASEGAGISGVLLSALRRAAADFDPSERRGISTTIARNLERQLETELAAAGVDLRRFDLDAIDYLAVEEGSSPPTDTKLLIVGLDGGDWEIVDELVAQGRLPNLGSLIESGVRAKLLSISPMLSPVIWTSVASGVEPGRHGVLDFIVEDPATGERQPVTSAQRQVPTFWEMLSAAGVDVGVVGWWATWPADPVRGYLVSDRLAYQLFGFRSDPDDAQGKTWPPELYQEEVRGKIVAPASVGWDQVQPYLSGPRTGQDEFDSDEQTMLEELRTLIAAGETYHQTARQLADRFQPQLEVVYFEGTDTVGHLFMPYRLPALAGVDPQRIASFSQVVDRYYETADRYLGEILEGRDESWTVMVISDHGFATDATRPQSTDSRIGHGAAADWHRRFGLLVLSGAGIRTQQRIEEASIYDIAPTVLALFGQPIPQSWPGKVLGQAIDPAFLDAHPVAFRRTDPPRDSTYATGEVPVDPAADELIERLQSLGYISSGTYGSESVTARNNAGVALLSEGRFTEAEREFRAGLEAQPDAAMLQVNLAVALRLQGKLQEAVGLLELAFESPTTMRMAGTVLAQIHIDQGDLEQAERRTRRVLEVEQEAADVRNLLGRVLEQQDRIDEARTEYARSAEADPDLAPPRNNLGNLAKLAGRFAEAERWYLSAIEADPYFMGAYNNLALVYQDQGEMQKALDLYERALAKAPNNGELLNNVASWYFATGDAEEARELWGRAAAADPRNPSPLNNLAGLAITRGRFEDAERLLLKALEIDPNYGDARMNLALVLGNRGDVAGARAELKLATEDPRSLPGAWAQLGMFDLRQGFVGSAAEALEHALAAGGNDPRLWLALGEAYRLDGRGDEAVDAWRRSLQLDPEQAELRKNLELLEASVAD